MARPKTTPTLQVETPVELGTGLLIAWTGTAVRRLVVAWPSGTVSYPVQGAGSKNLLARELGTVTVSIRANGLTLATKTSVVQEAPVAVIIPEEPPPPPTPPQVIAATPIPGSTGKVVTVNAKATFDMDMDPATITGATMTISPSVACVVSYDAPTKVATLNPDADLADGTEYTITLSTAITNTAGTALAVPYSWTFTTAGVAPGPGDFSIVGWAGNRPTPVTGGTGGTILQPTTWAEFADAVGGTTGPRIVRPIGGINFNAASDSFNVDAGDLTIDGSNYGGSLRTYDVQFKCDNVIITNMRLRCGDQHGGPNDQDSMTINPGSGGVMSGFVLDHCSLLWSLDMCIALLNHVTYVTVQHCIIGAGLRQSNKPDNPKGLGNNISVPANNEANEATEHGDRITFYRNVILHNFERNVKAERASLVEFYNNVIYNWGSQVGHGNPRSINILQNWYQKGTNTTTSRVWEDDPNYATFANSVHFPFASNVFRNQNGTTAFTPTGDHVGTAEERATPNAQSTVTIGTMDATLKAAVIANAGPAQVDTVDQTMKDDAANGTGQFYNGIDFAAPNPTYPAPI
jgi:hypothetical protein